MRASATTAGGRRGLVVAAFASRACRALPARGPRRARTTVPRDRQAGAARSARALRGPRPRCGSATSRAMIPRRLERRAARRARPRRRGRQRSDRERGVASNRSGGGFRAIPPAVVSDGLLELGHGLAKRPRELRKSLRAEEECGEDESMMTLPSTTTDFAAAPRGLGVEQPRSPGLQRTAASPAEPVGPGLPPAGAGRSRTPSS